MPALRQPFRSLVQARTLALAVAAAVVVGIITLRLTNARWMMTGSFWTKLWLMTNPWSVINGEWGVILINDHIPGTKGIHYQRSRMNDQSQRSLIDDQRPMNNVQWRLMVVYSTWFSTVHMNDLPAWNLSHINDERSMANGGWWTDAMSAGHGTDLPPSHCLGHFPSKYR